MCTSRLCCVVCLLNESFGRVSREAYTGLQPFGKHAIAHGTLPMQYDYRRHSLTNAPAGGAPTARPHTALADCGLYLGAAPAGK